MTRLSQLTSSSSPLDQATRSQRTPPRQRIRTRVSCTPKRSRLWHLTNVFSSLVEVQPDVNWLGRSKLIILRNRCRRRDVHVTFPADVQRTQVTLVSRSVKLIGADYPDKLSSRIKATMESMGIVVKTGVAAECAPRPGPDVEADAKPVKVPLSNGEILEVDRIFFCIGYARVPDEHCRV